MGEEQMHRKSDYVQLLDLNLQQVYNFLEEQVKI